VYGTHVIFTQALIPERDEDVGNIGRNVDALLCKRPLGKLIKEDRGKHSVRGRRKGISRQGLQDAFFRICHGVVKKILEKLVND
jgi:hypothetical protein